MRALLLGFVVIVATEPGVAAVSGRSAIDERELVSGAALDLAKPLEPIQVPTRDDVLALDDEMRAFVAPLKLLRDPRQRMHALIRAMEERGMFSLDYAEITRTARDTFHDRQGNCLSFTMLFVTLARAAGLNASYRSVDVPPSWSYDGKVVTANHVNTVVRTWRHEETVVDFNIRPYQADQPSRRVSDAYALGLFYTNLAAEAMLREDYAAALAHLREAASVEADIAGLWVNLGVLYARHGRFEHAEAAYLRALEAEEDEQSALANLVLVYDALEERELAAEYRARVQSYRERNPYYHYTVAQRAYAEQRFADALESVRKALRLKRDEHAFYTLRGQVENALGKEREATQSFARAREHEEAAALRARSLVEFQAPPL